MTKCLMLCPQFWPLEVLSCFTNDIVKNPNSSYRTYPLIIELFAIENGPVEIVSFSINRIVFFHSFCKRLSEDSDG